MKSHDDMTPYTVHITQTLLLLVNTGRGGEIRRLRLALSHVLLRSACRLSFGATFCFAATRSINLLLRSRDDKIAAKQNGEGEIRTLEGLTTPPVFGTGAFNHSATSPVS